MANNRRVYREDICLFGKHIVNHCSKVSDEVLAVEAKQVAEAAKQIRASREAEDNYSRNG